MILGNWKQVDDEQDDIQYHYIFEVISLQENQRREAGWIILDGLINLGN